MIEERPTITMANIANMPTISNAISEEQRRQHRNNNGQY